MRMTRNRAAPVLLLACMLAACVDHPPTSVLAPESLPARERQALAQLKALGYRGPVMFTESRAVDALGEHPLFWTLGVNEQGVRLLADARAAKSPHAAALDGVLAASESTDPDQIDAGNNTPTSQLAGKGILPSIRSSRCNSISTMNIRTRLYVSDWSTGQFVQLQEADILELRFTPRANAAGHYHGGSTISDVRVGTFTPASGRMTGGVWQPSRA